jgi:hypothetical protein
MYSMNAALVLNLPASHQPEPSKAATLLRISPHAAAALGANRFKVDPHFRPVRTAVRTYHHLPSEWHRAQERKRRDVLLALGSPSGFFPQPPRSPRSHPILNAEPTPRAAPPSCALPGSLVQWSAFQSSAPTRAPAKPPPPPLTEAQAEARAAWRDALRDRLVATPTASRRDLRATISRHNKARPPSRAHIIAAHRAGVRTAGVAAARPPASGGEAAGAAEDPAVAEREVQRVWVEDISKSTVLDPSLCVLPLRMTLHSGTSFPQNQSFLKQRRL